MTASPELSPSTEQDVAGLVALPSGRDIWEVANQLEGYVDMTTPKELAAFLLREGKAASELAEAFLASEARATALEAERDSAYTTLRFCEEGWSEERGAMIDVLQALEGEIASLRRSIGFKALEGHVAEIHELKAQLARARETARLAHDTLIEINPNNYAHDDVVTQNDASVEAIYLLADVLGETHGKTPEWWAARREALRSIPAPADGRGDQMLASASYPQEPSRVKPLEWKFYPQAFPPCWCAQTPFGDCVVEEEAGSDSPTYAARGIRMNVVARTEGLPEAKVAAHTDYEHRVLSALAADPQNENDPPCGQVLIDGVWKTMHDLHAFNGYAADGYQTRPASESSGRKLADAAPIEPPTEAREDEVKVAGCRFTELRVAYKRGVAWALENPGVGSAWVEKAAYDYADKATSSALTVPPSTAQTGDA